MQRVLLLPQAGPHARSTKRPCHPAGCCAYAVCVCVWGGGGPALLTSWCVLPLLWCVVCLHSVGDVISGNLVASKNTTFERHWEVTITYKAGSEMDATTQVYWV